MRLSPLAAVALLLCCTPPSAARAQAPACESQVVGFSGDGKVALVRSHVIPGEPGNAARLGIVRLELATKKLLRSHHVLTAKDLEEWEAAHPAAADGQAEAAMRKLRGQRWSELERLLAKDGFKLEPSYAALPKQGSELDARFALPGGAALSLNCKRDEDGSMHRCDLVASRGDKRAIVLPRLYEEPFSFLSMNWLESVYADPGGRYLIAIDRFAGASELGSGLRVLELATIEAGLR